MHFKPVFAGLGAIVLGLAACAQQEAPPPSAPIPLFDKSGTALCRPEGQPIDPTFPGFLPICEEVCEDTSQVGSNYAICPPVTVSRQSGGQSSGGGRTPPPPRPTATAGAAFP